MEVEQLDIQLSSRVIPIIFNFSILSSKAREIAPNKALTDSIFIGLV